MVTRLSERNNNITQVPSPQSPDKAGMQGQWLGTSANLPDNWLIADGSSLDRSTYSQLFNAIGTRYGEGDTPGTTFALPSGQFITNEMSLSLLNFTDGFQISYAFGRVYNDQLNRWYIDFNLRVEGGLVTNTFMECEINGIQFWTSGGKTEQAISVASSNTQPITVSVAYHEFGVAENRIQMGGEGSHNTFTAHGHCRLDSKPIDAIVTVDPNFAVLDDAMQYVPIIKAYDDAGSVAISSI